MSRGDTLTLAVNSTDLPALIGERYPESGAKPGTPGVVFATWRGNENTPAVSLSKVQGCWVWKDHATGEGGAAFEWLTTAEGYSPQEAATYLVERAGLTTQEATSAPQAASSTPRGPRYQPVPVEAAEALTGASGPIPALASRGFTLASLKTYGLSSDNGHDALIPITSPEGVVLQVKRRVHGATQAGHKYRYEHTGHGAPAWCSSNSRDAPTLLIVEGELNAIIAHDVLSEAGQTDIGVMGVSGANNPIYPGLAKGKRVLIYADDDDAGEKARAAWAKQAHDGGARSVHTIAPHHLDYCEQAGRHGRGSLVDLIDAGRISAKQVYGAADRMLGTITVKEAMLATQRFLDGGVMHSTGFSDVDNATGGIRETGVYSIGALSSIGKSAVMRRMLLAHVRDGGTVRVYSPDQGALAIYRLLANQLSGVGMEEIRLHSYSQDALTLWGSPEKAKDAWWESYQYVLNELAPRFQISEESRSSEIVKDMERAVDEGVSMFGIDYMQLIRPASRQGADGDQADEMKVASGAYGAPIISALQLAKYKFPPERKDGLPRVGDIEGSGAYFQGSEMVFLLYNEGIYGAKYAGDRWEPVGDPPDTGRLLMVKDKEGGGHEQWLISWHARLACYSDYGRYDLKRERRGLM